MTLNLNYSIDFDDSTLANYIEDYDAAEHSLADLNGLQDFIYTQLTRYFCSEVNLPDDYDERLYERSDLISEGLNSEQCNMLRAFIKEGVFKFIQKCFNADN